MPDEGATQFGSIKAVLTLDKSDYVAGLKAAGVQADELGKHDPKIHVEVNAKEAIAQLLAIQQATARTDQSTQRLARNSDVSSRRMRALMTAIIALGPAIIPVAAAATGLGVGFTAAGVAGVLAIVGIKREMEQGTVLGAAFTRQVDVLKGNVKDLSLIAAKGVLGPFRDAVADLQRRMPALTGMVGDFSVITGRTASALFSGLLAAFVQLEPLMADVSMYTLDLSRRFNALMSGPGVVTFGDYVRSVFPQVMQNIEDIVGAVLHLVAAFAPLGVGVLGMLGALSSLISGIPVEVLATLATTAYSVYAGFKTFTLIRGLILGVSSGLVKLGVSAGIAATGMTALTVASAGIGAIIAVATFLYSKHAEAVRKDQQAVDDYTQALRTSNGVIDENVRSTAFKQLQDNGAFDAAKKLGISLNLVTDAALGSTYASRQLALEMSNAAKAQNEFEAGGARTGKTSAEVNSALATLNASVGTNTRQFADAQQAQKDWAAASQPTTVAANAQERAQAALAGKLGSTYTALQAAIQAQKQTADSTAAATLQMQLQNDAAGLLRGTLDLLNGKALSAAEAQNAFDSSLANMGTHVTKTGKQVTFTTTSIKDMSSASVALRGQLNGQIANLQRVVEANGGMANSTGKAKAEMVKMRQQIIDNAVAHGVDRKAVTAYVDSILKIPKSVPPTKLDIDSKAALTKLAAFKAALAGLKNKTVVVTTQGRFINNQAAPGSKSTVGGQVKGSGATGGLILDGVKRYDSGGLITGPGTGTSDSILAAISGTANMIRVSNQEFISTAASQRRNRAALEAGNKGATLTATRPGGGDGIDYERLAATIAAQMRHVVLAPVVSAGSFDRAMGGQLR